MGSFGLVSRQDCSGSNLLLDWDPSGSWAVRITAGFVSKTTITRGMVRVSIRRAMPAPLINTISEEANMFNDLINKKNLYVAQTLHQRARPSEKSVRRRRRRRRQRQRRRRRQTTRRATAKPRLKLRELTSKIWNKHNPCSCGGEGRRRWGTEGGTRRGEGGSGVRRVIEDFSSVLLRTSDFYLGRRTTYDLVFIMLGPSGRRMISYDGSEKVNFQISS